MKRILSPLLLVGLFACSKNENPEPESKAFPGKYTYSVKSREVDEWGAFDINVTITEKSGRYGVDLKDWFADSTGLFDVVSEENVITATQHVEEGFDTRDLTVILTNNDGSVHMDYTVDFLNGYEDFHLDAILRRK